MFQHTAARRRLPIIRKKSMTTFMFQHTAARRRLLTSAQFFTVFLKVSTHSRPKAAAVCQQFVKHRLRVSTHSRPKAAAAFCGTPANTGFKACDSPTLPQKAVGASIARSCARVRPINFLIVKELFVIAKPPVFCCAPQVGDSHHQRVL